VALSLGVLAAALVKLAGETGPPPPAITRTVTTAAAAPAPTTAAITPAPEATTTPALPGATTSTQAGVATNPIVGSNTATGAVPPAGGTQPPRSKTLLTPAQRKRLSELNLSGSLRK